VSMSSKKIGVAFFQHVAPTGSQLQPGVLGCMLRSLDSGLFSVPKSYRVLSKFPTEEPKLRHTGRPQHINLPESRLMVQFYKRFPEAKLQPVALGSSDPPLAKQYALKQWKLMREKRLSADNAAKEVEKAMAPQLQALSRQHNISRGLLDLIQNEEEIQLKKALEDLAGRQTVGGSRR